MPRKQVQGFHPETAQRILNDLGTPTARAFREWVRPGSGGSGLDELFLTPEGGIPAMTITDGRFFFGKALCHPVLITATGSNNLEGQIQQETQWVYSLVSGAIPGGVIVKASRTAGYPFVDTVDCQVAIDFSEGDDNPFLEDDPFDEGLTI